MTGGKIIAGQFRARYGVNPRVYRAPGRANLIGEHTNYNDNDGFVMRAALGFYCWATNSPRQDHKLVVSSEEFPDVVEVELSADALRPPHTGSGYSNRGFAAVRRVHGRIAPKPGVICLR